MISVCIATYNGERYIEQQLESILSQLTDDDEVIISDDSSTDATVSVIKAMDSPIIHLFNNDREHGYTSNFENALMHARGDYIFLSDQDDVWTKDKVAVCMDLLKSYDMVVSDAYVVDSDMNTLYDSYYELRNPKRTLIGNIVKFGYLGCCLAFNSIVLTKALPFPCNHKLCTHDNWLFLVAKTFYKVKITNNKLIYYRRHQGNTSEGGIKDTTSIFFKIHYRMYLIKHLLRIAHK